MRIFIAICSAVYLRDRRQACRDTWVQDIKDLAPNVDYKFFVGVPEVENEQPTELEADVVQLQCNDTYHRLPEKIHSILQYVEDNCEYDYVFKCDDDTYVIPDRLERLCKNGDDYIGEPMSGMAAYGGAGYFLSKKAVKTLLASPAWKDNGMEDMHIGELCRANGISVVKGEGLHGRRYPLPAFNNDIVTNHSVHATDYYWRREAFKSGIAAVGQLILSPVRKDYAGFFNNGVFTMRGTVVGSYRYDKKEQVLHLNYTIRQQDLNVQFKRKDARTFVANDKTLIFEESTDAWLLS